MNFLQEKREALGRSLDEMAAACDCSWGLLEALECGDFPTTHPNIAARIARAYGLNLEEYNQIVPEARRAKRLPKPQKRPALRDFRGWDYTFREKW